jgi:Chondroitinase B
VTDPPPAPAPAPAPNPAPAGAYYVSASGSDSGAGSATSPWKSFAKAFASMKAGDVLVVKNGVYSESLGGSAQPPSGSAGKPTIIRAESDGGVVIDAKGQNVPLTLDGAYVRVEGIKFLNGSSWVGQLNGNNLEVLRCAFGNGGSGMYDGILNASGNDILIEDSWMWGRGKAGIEVNGGRTTLRRLVIRLDYYASTMGYMGVLLYGAYDTLVENVITLDFNTSSTTFDWKGGFRSRDMSDTRTQRYYGTIALNLPYDGYRMSDSHYENVIAWAVAGKGGMYEDSWKTGYSVKNATVGSTSTGGISANDSSVLNSLLYRVSGGTSGGQHNLFFETAVPSDAVDALTTDPQLKYITRVEPGSPAEGSGSDGANRGATVTHRYVNGALTTQPLWPWPNEARIKADFQTDFGLPGVNPRRGFAATGNSLRGTPITLTSYVWEFLGNPCPPDICH